MFLKSVAIANNLTHAPQLAECNCKHTNYNSGLETDIHWDQKIHWSRRSLFLGTMPGLLTRTTRLQTMKNALMHRVPGLSPALRHPYPIFTVLTAQHSLFSTEETSGGEFWPASSLPVFMYRTVLYTTIYRIKSRYGWNETSRAMPK